MARYSSEAKIAAFRRGNSSRAPSLGGRERHRSYGNGTQCRVASSNLNGTYLVAYWIAGSVVQAPELIAGVRIPQNGGRHGKGS